MAFSNRTSAILYLHRSLTEGQWDAVCYLLGVDFKKLSTDATSLSRQKKNILNDMVLIGTNTRPMESVERRFKKKEDLGPITEIRKKLVIRGGKRVRKAVCPDGYKHVDGRCVRIKATEKRNRLRGQRRGALKRKTTKLRANTRRKRSMRLRRSMPNSK